MERPPVFLIGAPRSGTTWLQQLLAAHPAVASSQELHLFSSYLGAWDAQWQRELPDSAADWQALRHQGLPAILTREELEALMHDVAVSVYGRVLAAKPGAEIVLDKCPPYVSYLPLIARCFPDARVIHLIRDGRDVAASLRRASRGWGRSWAPAGADQGARVWRTSVEAARASASAVAAYREVRFEDLSSPSGAELLAELLAFTGVEASAGQAASIYDAFRLGSDGAPPSSIVFAGEVARRAGRSPSEPPGFFGEGRVGAWRDAFSAFDRWLFEREAGALLCDLAYERNGSWVAPGAWRLLGPFRQLASRVYWALRYALGAARRGFDVRARTA